MKRTSNIFYLVSIILSILSIVSCVLMVVLMAVTLAGTMADTSEFVIINGTKYQRSVVVASEIMLIAFFVVDLVLTVLHMVFAINCRSNEKASTAMHILSMVFGVLSGMYFAIPAGILALVYSKQQKQNSPTQNEIKSA